MGHCISTFVSRLWTVCYRGMGSRILTGPRGVFDPCAWHADHMIGAASHAPFSEL